MKRHIAVLAAFSVIALLSGCQWLFGTQGTSQTKGSLVISVSEVVGRGFSARTVTPQADYYRVRVFSGSSLVLDHTHVLNVADPIFLNVGMSFSIQVDSFDGSDRALYSGSTTVMMNNGTNNAQVFLSSVEMTKAGTGNFVVTYEWPDIPTRIAIDPFVASVGFSLQAVSVPGAASGAEFVDDTRVHHSSSTLPVDPVTKKLDPAQIEATDLPSGEYRLRLNVTSPAGHVSTISEIVHVFDDRLSAKTIRLTDQDLPLSYQKPASPYVWFNTTSNSYILSWELGSEYGLTGYRVTCGISGFYPWDYMTISVDDVDSMGVLNVDLGASEPPNGAIFKVSAFYADGGVSFSDSNAFIVLG
ncbi:MAG: hypothetical protein WCQ50_00205 [Spirochaetota bacterium]